MSTNVLYGFFFGCSSCCSPVREKTSGCDCNVIVWFVAVRFGARVTNEHEMINMMITKG